MSDYATELLTPMYENIVCEEVCAVLHMNDLIYYFKETIDGNSYRSEKELCQHTVEKGEPGRYGRLNDIILEEDRK